MTENTFKGNFGEDQTVKYLKKHRYKIVARNYRRKCGEIDIIASKKGILVFVEVKTRKQGSMISGYEAVNYTKQKRIIRAADCYLYENFDPGEELPVDLRYDIAEVVIDDSEKKIKITEFNYYENAFDATNFKTHF